MSRSVSPASVSTASTIGLQRIVVGGFVRADGSGSDRIDQSRTCSGVAPPRHRDGAEPQVIRREVPRRHLGFDPASEDAIPEMTLICRR